MNATPPEAKPEYSRAPGASGGLAKIGNSVPTVVLAGGLIGSLLLVVAELSTLFSVRTATSGHPIQSVSAGSHHAYALIPIAILAALLTYGAWRHGSRPALVAIGALGLVTLVIALAGDLPDAHASGLIGLGSARFANASSTPQAGLYLETLGAALLVMSTGLGLLLGGPPPAKRRTAQAGVPSVPPSS